ncbi:NAD(P)H-dependent oxidoreductase [Actinoallomurus sp. NPDC050550]|uniref:NAD(P)H-dependent oxidoreductase n=1 Tax=Actinoallomurus sp. NPDC050550 TaxID=3154937 RepID=UPI0033C368DC
MSNILVVSAHPEPRSLNGALAAFAADELRRERHEVLVSDLYAMKWKPAVDADDFLDHDPGERLDVIGASGRAYTDGRLSPEIAAEQDKLLWADAVILQFPMWWFSMPAILKGWVDRVLTYRFGYGTGKVGRALYGDGTLAGRRAMLSLTIGADEPSFSARGVHGRLDDLLFPIQHGILYYTGMDVLPPFVVFDSLTVDEERFGRLTDAYGERLRALFTTEPVPYRPLKGGDYTRSMELKPGLEPAGAGGLAIHLCPDER